MFLLVCAGVLPACASTSPEEHELATERAAAALTTVPRCEDAPDWQVRSPISTAGISVSGYLSFDITIPTPQTNPSWNGTLDAYLSVPSAGLSSVLLGTQTLNGRAAGSAQTVAYKLPREARAALAAPRDDVHLCVAFMAPQPSSEYDLRDPRFDFAPEDDDHVPVFGFEAATHFTATAPIFSSSDVRVEGSASLGVQANGYTVVNSRPFYTGGFTASDEVSLWLHLPAGVSGWKGQIGLHVLTTSGGAQELPIGYVELSGFPSGQFNQITFAVPEHVRQRLRARRTDGQLKVILNVPPGGTYYLDDLRFAPPVITPDRTATLPLTIAEVLQLAQPSGTLSLPLFGDVTLVLEDIQRGAGTLGENITARIAEPVGGVGYLSVAGDALYGVLRARSVNGGGAKNYRLTATGTNPIRVVEIDPGEYPREQEPHVPTSFDRPVVTLSQTSSAQQALHTNPQHDVLVVFTPAVEAAIVATGSTVAAMVLAAENLANTSYADSGINQRIRIVHSELINYTESSDFGTNLDRLRETNDGHIDEVHAIRDRHGADLVVLLVNGGSSCGKADLAVVSSDADDDHAFAVADWNCIDDHSFTHELGHIAGAHHDTYVDPFPLPTYAHGFVSLEGSVWRTIMAYPDECEDEGHAEADCERIGFFSTPDRNDPMDGLPLGNETWSNNVRRLNETAITLEGFRIQGPRVSLYEGNGGTQDHVCVVSTEVDGSVNFTDSSDMRFCDNDEARSLKIFEMPADRVIRLYDSPDGSTEDDWVQITTKRPIAEKLIPTFENTFEDADVRVIYHTNNGLDGKVSRLEVASAVANPVVDLHEGNNATQNLVCSLPVGQSIDVDFQNHGQCDNDEARSMTLFDVPAGTVIRVFDSPSGAREDDWTEIVVKRDLLSRVIDTFEQSLDDADVRVVYHRNNGLDGKVSRLEVTFEPTGAVVDLYEGNNGSQNLVCSVTAGQPISINFQDDEQCDNDEARSATLYSMPAGTIVFLYDNPSGNREDDWVAIEALRDIAAKTINSFESTFEDEDVRVLYFPNNGLDGKVSRLEVRSSTTLSGILSFYEGNNGTQNKVCDLNSLSQVVRFPSHSACDNDETRSLVLTLVSAGTRIEVFDDPDCTTGDDWTEILVKRAVFRATIGTYERSFENDDFLVTHHHDNGLDGKVSCVRVIAP